MTLLGFCCCWVSIRKGSFASAIYTMVYFGLIIIVIVTFNGADEDSIANEPDAIFSSLGNDPKVILAINIAVAAFAGLGIVSCFLLMYGLVKKISALLIPWMTVVLITTLVDLSYVFYLIALVSFNPITALLFVGDFVLIFLNVYALLCVTSQYQEYTSEVNAADNRSHYRPNHIFANRKKDIAINLTTFNHLASTKSPEISPRPTRTGAQGNDKRTVSFVTNVLCECDGMERDAISKNGPSLQADVKGVSSGSHSNKLTAELSSETSGIKTVNCDEKALYDNSNCRPENSNLTPPFRQRSHTTSSYPNQVKLYVNNNESSKTSTTEDLHILRFPLTTNHVNGSNKQTSLTCILSATPSTSATSVTSPASENNHFRSGIMDTLLLPSCSSPLTGSGNERVSATCQWHRLSP